MQNKITKAIIPAAGFGTRFLPATKSQPKEMLPVVDKPTIQYIVEEAVDSGIEDILIVIGRYKSVIEDHFDRSVELEMELEKKGKYDLLEQIQDIAGMGAQIDHHDGHGKDPDDQMGQPQRHRAPQPFSGQRPIKERCL